MPVRAFVSDDDLEGLRRLAGLDREQAARLFGRSTRTWQRWLHEGAPPWIVPLLRLWGGDLGVRWPSLRGWYVAERRRPSGHRYQVLVSDALGDAEVTPHTLCGLHYLVDAIRHLEARIARLETRHPDCAECLHHSPPGPAPGWLDLDDLDELGERAAAWLLERLARRAAA